MASRNSRKPKKAVARRPKKAKVQPPKEEHAPQKALPQDREAYLSLFLLHLPDVDRFVRRRIHFLEETGAVERGLIDPCSIVDQVYIAALANFRHMPATMEFRTWLRFLAMRILRQQVRIEHLEEPAGLALEREFEQEGDIDGDLWEFYQPDDVVSIEDTVGDGKATDPLLWLEQRETATEIERLMEQLPPELREAARMRLIEGLKADEIAALKHETTDAVRQAIRDACAALRQGVRQDGA